MLEVMRIVVDGENENVEYGCNNGMMKPVTVITRDSETGTIGEFPIVTCGCHQGCHGLDRCPDVGMTFKSVESLLDFMHE